MRQEGLVAHSGIGKLKTEVGAILIDGVLFFKLMLLVTGDEGERVDVLVKIPEREFRGVHTTGIQLEWFHDCCIR
jgi:hypothetical protein